MNYELAKKLKEAGFPKLKNWIPDELVFGGDIWEELYKPTLLELIEACGDAFSTLNKITHSGKPEHWAAISDSCDECKRDKTYFKSGTTPEEAVANLWLALHNSH